jgi:hypothetical protein
MKDTNKFNYGEVYDIAPVWALDAKRGQIQILAILHPDMLPAYVDLQSWLTGDRELDFDIQTEPWYFYKYIDDENEETFDLPQSALELGILKALDEKMKLIKQQTNIDRSEQNAIR